MVNNTYYAIPKVYLDRAMSPIRHKKINQVIRSNEMTVTVIVVLYDIVRAPVIRASGKMPCRDFYKPHITSTVAYRLTHPIYVLYSFQY